MRQVRLGDILRPRKETVHPYDKPRGMAVFVGLEHLESGTGRRIGALEIDLETLTGRKPKFYEGDIVYGYLRPYLNKVWVAEFDGLCSVDQYVYEVDRSVANAEFVAWFMRSPHYLEQAPVQAGPGQLPRIRLEEVAGVELELPDLNQQTRIAGAIRSRLAAVEQARAAAEDQFAAAKRLAAAYLRKVFAGAVSSTWQKTVLGDLCEVQLGKMLSPAARLGTEPKPYLRNANVQWNRFDLSSLLRMDFSGTEAKKFELRPGDILVCEGGEPGRAAVWAGQIVPCFYQKALHRLRVRRDRAIPTFIMYRLWFGGLTGEFVGSHAKTTIAHLPAIRLERLPVAVPSISEQKGIVRTLEGAFAKGAELEGAAREQLRQIDAMPALLLRRAFSGEL